MILLFHALVKPLGLSDIRPNTNSTLYDTSPDWMVSQEMNELPELSLVYK